MIKDDKDINDHLFPNIRKLHLLSVEVRTMVLLFSQVIRWSIDHTNVDQDCCQLLGKKCSIFSSFKIEKILQL